MLRMPGFLEPFRHQIVSQNDSSVLMLTIVVTLFVYHIYMDDESTACLISTFVNDVEHGKGCSSEFVGH